MRDFNLDATTKAQFTENIEIVKETNTILAKQQQDLDATAKLLCKAGKMHISDELRKYIRMQQIANNVDSELTQLTKQILAEIKKMYETMCSSEHLSEKESSAIKQTILGLVDKAKAHQSKAKSLRDKAMEYYRDYDLGQ